MTPAEQFLTEQGINLDYAKGIQLYLKHEKEQEHNLPELLDAYLEYHQIDRKQFRTAFHDYYSLGNKKIDELVDWVFQWLPPQKKS